MKLIGKNFEADKANILIEKLIDDFVKNLENKLFAIFESKKTNVYKKFTNLKKNIFSDSSFFFNEVSQLNN